MRFPRHKVIILSAAMLVAGVSSTICANAYTIPVVTYVNVPFSSGSNLFSNPLQTSTNNFLSEVLQSQGTDLIPEGASVSLWNPTNLSFHFVSLYTNGSWTSNFSLPPGMGVLVTTPVAFMTTVTGTVLDHDGNLYVSNLPPPQVYSGPNGIFLLGDKAPITDAGTNIFLNILGRPPFPGEQVITLSATNTYLGSGVWDTIPVLYAGQSAFLNVSTVPSPALNIVELDNQVIVSWPSSYTTNWILQTNGDLTFGSWGNYPAPIVNNSVTNSALAGQLYYRLIY